MLWYRSFVIEIWLNSGVVVAVRCDVVVWCGGSSSSTAVLCVVV